MASGNHLKVYEYPSAGTGIPIYPHPTNDLPHDKVANAIIQPIGGELRLGQEGVVSSSVGLRIFENERGNLAGIMLRGSAEYFDLSKIFYVGVAFQLIIEVRK